MLNDEPVQDNLEDQIKITPDAYMNLTKQRHFEWEGSVPLWFHSKSLRYRDRP
jgi:hypothetical protein